MKSTEYITHTLPNGLRLIHHHIPGEVAHAGLMIHTGSRDEEEQEHGLAHFIEHLLFKGTRRRKAYHILSRIDDAGGELNAYTTKEETCVYASFLRRDYERALELISDIVFHSIFPEKEMEREKEVIIDEIRSYLDNPAEMIFDEFEELVFRHQPIGRNILGTEHSVNRFTREDVLRFRANHYHTNEMALSSVGNVPFPRLVRWFEKYFGDVPAHLRNKSRSLPGPYHPEKMMLEKNTYQTHCVLGTTAYDVKNEKRLGLYLLNNILGGQGLNSRLNLSLREKSGYAYNIESSYHPYTDAGILSIYFGTDRKNLEKSLAITHRELEKLRNRQLGDQQLRKARKQITGQLARGMENHESLMQSLAKSLLVFGEADPPEVLYRKIEAIRAEELQEIANEIFNPDGLSQLVYL
ncbi:MAG TPA: insulinase family protein [Bacteroidetes bacterium]|nr:insulinase family protein [Bacteroidota bacterium]